MSERGSVTVMWIAVIGLFAILCVGLADLGITYAARARAATAADAAALAAATATYPPLGRFAPSREAARAAGLNAATLQRCICRIDASLAERVVTVTVSVRVELPLFGIVDVSNTSSAEFSPVRWLGG